MTVKVVPAHPIVSGMLVCNVVDGRAMSPNEPDPWTFCPYCGLRLMDGLMVGVSGNKAGCTCGNQFDGHLASCAIYRPSVNQVNE